MPTLATLAEVARASDEQLAEIVGLCLRATTQPVLARALELGLFARLAAGPVNLATLTAELTDRATPVSLAMTVELACSFGLLARRDDAVALTEPARLFLLEDAPLRLLGLVERHGRYMTGICALPDALREMGPADRRMWSDATDQHAQARYFQRRGAFNAASRRYFRDSAVLLARAHCRRDLAAHRVVCDVGAGPAAFAALLKQAAPALRVHAVEVDYKQPDYLAATVADLHEAGVAVELHARNFLHEPPPPDIDLLTANRVFSGLSRAGAEGWARRLFAGLAPGGTLAMVDFFRTGAPAHDQAVGELYALWMAWNQHELTRDPPVDPHDDRHAWGWNPPWSHAELRALLERVGFVDVRVRSVVPPFALCEARRP